jgi:hypothetical protein
MSLLLSHLTNHSTTILKLMKIMIPPIQTPLTMPLIPLHPVDLLHPLLLQPPLLPQLPLPVELLPQQEMPQTELTQQRKSQRRSQRRRSSQCHMLVMILMMMPKEMTFRMISMMKKTLRVSK